MGNSNRIIKFRAWDLESKKMFLVNKILWGAYPVDMFQVQGIIIDDEIKIMNICDDDCEHDSPHCKVMQYTGLKDKNGKEIYEGDILKSSYTEFGHEVVFDRGHFAIKHSDKCCPPYKTSLREARDWQEIIGNIYENPKLLK